MIAGKNLLDDPNLFSLSDYSRECQSNIYKNFKYRYGKRRYKPKIAQKINQKRNYLLDKIKYNDLMSEERKKVSRPLSYFEQLLILVSAVSECDSIFPFASLFGVSVYIISPAAGLKICA